MSIASEDPHNPCFEIKSADLSLVALLLKTTDVAEVSRALKHQLAESPGFFDQDPVVIDISALTLKEDETIDFKALIAALQEHALVPLAIKGASGRLLDLAKGHGLVDASDARIRRSMPIAEAAPTQAPVVEPVAPAPTFSSAMRIDKPLRSGQQIYAKGADLVVKGTVGAGAEVIADGNIHIYGTLRGKAIAGAAGDSSKRIFCYNLQAELVSIAGNYWLSESLQGTFWGKAATIKLQDDQLVLAELV